MKARYWLVTSIVGVIVGGSIVFLWLRIRKVEADLLQVRWESAMDDHNRLSHEVNLDVGVIQFIAGGYSITLDSVTYEPNGVTLVGRLGNQNALQISSLTLNLEVRRQFWKRHDEFVRTRGGFDFYFSDSTSIGKAQVALGQLPAGAQIAFRASIPNVKQTQEKYALDVGFTGERYSYIR